MAKYTASDDGKVIDGKIVVWLWPPKNREATAERNPEPAQPVTSGAAVRTADGTAPSEASGKEPDPPDRAELAKKPGLPAAASAILSHARFDDPRDLQGGGAVWLLARAAGLEGRCVQVVLEREGKPGEWVAVGQATATVRSGAVRAAVTPDPGSEPAPSR
jgi:hypothetical protein